MICDYPLMFTPILKTRVWGGERLKAGQAGAPAEPVGERWELCDRPDDQSVVANGPLAGRTLGELYKADPVGVAGWHLAEMSPERFPWLLKLLEARRDLSVQVHPDDDLAAEKHPGERGKTEAWYVLDAEKNAWLWCGVRPGVDEKNFDAAVRDGTVVDRLIACPAAPGETYFIPAGTVHALGAGLVIAEIQQNSDVTYRLYDWGRVGLDGKPRALHLDDGLEATLLDPGVCGNMKPLPLSSSGGLAANAPYWEGRSRERLAACGYFSMELWTIDDDEGRPFTTGTGQRTECHLWLVVKGAARFVGHSGGEAKPNTWQSLLMPAATRDYSIFAEPGAVLLRIRPGPPRPQERLAQALGSDEEG